MNFNKKRQFRLPDYDYTDPGNYFITICIQDRRQNYFGKIIEGEMILSPLGKIVNDIWQLIPEKFPGFISGEYCIMPDHFHAILRNNNTLRLKKEQGKDSSEIKNNPMELKDKSIGYIIRWFKAKVKYESSKEYPLFRWQKRYYERVIRDDVEYYFVEEYIRNNPVNYGIHDEIVEEEYLNRLFSRNSKSFNREPESG